MVIIYIALGIFLTSSLIYVIWLRSIKKAASRRLTRFPSPQPRKWSPAWLKKQRQFTDPLADQLVDEIMRERELSKVNHLFGLMKNDGDRLSADAPPELKAYFQKTSQLPDWADPRLLKLGQQIYIRHGVWISLMLSYKSLPECYACAKGVEVLYHTGRLNEHHGSLNAFYRRIAETAQFVMDTMSPGGLSFHGKGLQAAQKVRLIHAIIRYYLQQQHWDEAKFDLPINQEDMAGTLMAFSALVLEGLETIGIRLDDVEKDAYIHCWRVVGHVMGLREELIPVNSQDALALGHAILNDQMGPSESGQVLMKALIDFQMSLTKGFLSEKANISMMRLMMGDKMSDLLGVPEIDAKEVLKLKKKMTRIARFMEFMEKSVVFSLLFRLVNQAMLHGMIWYMNRSSKINFYLPPSLTKDWGVHNDHAEKRASA